MVNGDRTILGGSDGLLDGVKEIVEDKKPIDEKIFSSKIEG